MENINKKLNITNRKLGKLFAGLLVAFVLISTSVAVCASTTTIDTSVIAYGARSVSLGRSSASLSLGTVSMFSNPAGIVDSSPWGVSSMSTQLLSRVNYQMLAGTYSYDNSTFGVGYLGASTPAGYYTTDSDSLASAQAIAYADTTLVLSYATRVNALLKNPRSIGNLAFGTNLRLLNKGFSGVSAISGYSGSGYALDLGIILDKGDGTAIGAALSNILSQVSWASGYAEALDSGLTLGVSRVLADGNLTLAGDVDFSFSSNPMTLHAGAEYHPFDLLSLRVGVDQSASTSGEDAGTTSTNLTAGIGINYEGVSFDYAYRSDATLSDNLAHYFSISYSPAVAEDISISKTNVNHVETSTQAKKLGEPNKAVNQSSIDPDLAELMELE